jgi:GMP synthase-like glutamine amidotransferase
MMEPIRERVVILDFGSQYVQLIARRVREQHVYSQIVRYDTPAAEIAALAPKGIILSGGPASVYEPNAPRCDPALWQLKIPILGICYGMQLLCQALGGVVEPVPTREFGRTPCRFLTSDPLLEGPAFTEHCLDEPRRSSGARQRRFRLAGEHTAMSHCCGSPSSASDLRPAVSPPKLPIPNTVARFFAISSTRFAVARVFGRWHRSLKRQCSSCVSALALTGLFAGCPAGWIPR